MHPTTVFGRLAATLLLLISAPQAGCIDTTIPDLSGELGTGPTAGRYCSPDDITEFRPKSLRLDIIDVGQGDAILVRTPYDEIEELESVHVLIDTGSAGTIAGHSPGGQVVVDYLNDHGHELGRPLDALIITHAHEDHYGGMPTVIANFPVSRYVDPGFVPNTNGFGGVRSSVTSAVSAGGGAIESPATSALGAAPVLVDLFGPMVTAHLLWASEEPPSGNTSNPAGTDINNTSVVISLSYGGRRVLLMGDAEAEVEALLVQKANAGELALVADVLKVGHHGSDTASSEEFIDAVFKEGFVDVNTYAAISSGVRNFSGTQLPTAETVERLNERLDQFHLLSTEHLDRGKKSSGEEHGDDHIVITIDEDGTVTACYGS